MSQHEQQIFKSQVIYKRIDQDINTKSCETCQNLQTHETQLQDEIKQEEKLPFCKQLLNNISSLCKLTSNIFGKSLKSKKFSVPNQAETEYGKKTLVLDLDETLVHSSHKNNNSDFSLQVKINNQQTTIYVHKRPYVEEFLLIMSEYYELIVFTASLAEYAKPTIEALDKYNKIKYKLYRENCTYWNGTLVKDMTTLNRNIRNVVLIDNSEQSAKFQPENSIIIKSFFSEKHDTELEYYIPFLIFLSKMNDIRPVQQYEKRFYLKKQFEVFNRETNQKQIINPNEYFEIWNEKKLKTQLIRPVIEYYVDTPVTLETEVFLNSPSRFALIDQQKIDNNIQLNKQQSELNNSGSDDEVGNEFPEIEDKKEIFKNLRIKTVRGEISNFNVNSPISLKQVGQVVTELDA